MELECSRAPAQRRGSAPIAPPPRLAALLRRHRWAPLHHQQQRQQRVGARCLGRPFQQGTLEGGGGTGSPAAAAKAGVASAASLARAAAQGAAALHQHAPLSRERLGQLRELVGRLERTATYGDKVCGRE